MYIFIYITSVMYTTDVNPARKMATQTLNSRRLSSVNEYFPFSYYPKLYFC